MFVQQIKDILRDIDSRNIDDLIFAKARLVELNRGYEDSFINAGEWVIDGINSLSREITNRTEAQLRKQLKTLEAQQEADASREERKSKRAVEIAALKKKLSIE